MKKFEKKIFFVVIISIIIMKYIYIYINIIISIKYIIIYIPEGFFKKIVFKINF